MRVLEQKETIFSVLLSICNKNTILKQLAIQWIKLKEHIYIANEYIYIYMYIDEVQIYVDIKSQENEQDLVIREHCNTIYYGRYRKAFKTFLCRRISR